MSRCGSALWRLLGIQALVRAEVERHLTDSVAADQRGRDHGDYWVDTQYVDEAVRTQVCENTQLLIDALQRQRGC